MSLITLLNIDGVSLTSDQRVFSAQESGALLSTLETAESMSQALSNTEATIEQARAQAQQEGYQAGYAAGRAEANHELARELLSLAEKANRDHQLQQQQAVSLAMQIVRKIAADLAPEQTLLALANSAARDCADSERITLTVHPDRLTGVRQQLEAHRECLTNVMKHAEVIADPALELDGCVIDTSLGSMVADLETQLDALTRDLMDTP